MSLFSWLWKKRSVDHHTKPISPDQVDDADPALREIVARVLNTGIAESGIIDPDGTVHVTSRYNTRTGQTIQ